MYGVVVREEKLRNGLVIQIVRTEECGGRYYMVTNGEPGYHSLDREKVEEEVDYYVNLCK